MGSILTKALHLMAVIQYSDDDSPQNETISRERLDHLFNSTFDEESDIFDRMFYLEPVGALVSILGLLVATIMTKRTNLCQNCCNGYFGLAVPVNFIEMKKRRLPLIASFALVSMVLVDVVFDSDIYRGMPTYLKVFAKMVMASGIACSFYPAFAFIYMGNLPSCIIGLIFHTIQMTLAILMEIPNKELTTRALIKELLLRGLVYAVAGTYIFYWYIKQIFRLCRKSKKDPYSTKQMKYVKHLFQNKERGLETERVLTLKEDKKSKFTKLFRKHIYCEVPGFKYSLTILASCTIGFLVVTHLTINILYGFIKNIIDVLDLLSYLTKFKEIKMTNVVAMVMKTLIATKSEETEAESKSEISVYDFLHSQSLIIVFGAIIGGIFAYILSVINILHLLTSYRENVLNLLKRKQELSILRISKDFSNIKLVKSAIQYGGFQIAYITAGFTIQLFVLNVFFILLGEVIVLPIQFALLSVVIKLLEVIGPIIITLIFIHLTQYLMIRFLFLEDNGKTLALTNRRGFFIMSYFVFFYNIFTGLFSCIKRILMGTIVGLILISRLDKSIFPRVFESRDAGFKTYSCLLHFEALQSNPIVITFVNIMLQRRIPRLSNANLSETDLLLHPKLPKNRKLALNRWFVAYTLIRNPTIITFRGKCNLLQVLEVLKTANNDRETNV